MTTQPTGPAPGYLALRPQTPTRIRISGWRWADRELMDPERHRIEMKRLLIMDVTEVDGVAQATSLSLLSVKAQNLVLPHLQSGEALRRVVEVTVRPRGYATEYEFRLL